MPQLLHPHNHGEMYCMNNVSFAYLRTNSGGCTKLRVTSRTSAPTTLLLTTVLTVTTLLLTTVLLSNGHSLTENSFLRKTMFYIERDLSQKN